MQQINNANVLSQKFRRIVQQVGHHLVLDVQMDVLIVLMQLFVVHVHLFTPSIKQKELVAAIQLLSIIMV